MTSTSSAAATGLPDRRRILSTLAGVGAFGVPALPPTLPTVAMAANGDAHLLELGRRLAEANALAADADRHLSAVSAVYDRAAPDVEPEALFVRPGDDLGLKTWPEKKRGKPTGRHIYGPSDIETAEAAMKVMDDEALSRVVCAPANISRLHEIVDSHVARREARRAAWVTCGMEEAEAAASTAHERCKEIMLEIAQCPATTPAGVQLKVRAAMVCFGDTAEEAEEQIDDVMAELSIGESLALSILRDMARTADLCDMGGAHA